MLSCADVIIHMLEGGPTLDALNLPINISLFNNTVSCTKAVEPLGIMPLPPLISNPPFSSSGPSSVCHLSPPTRWEFLKENKKVRKKEKKTRSRPRKRSRKEDFFFLFFLGRFLGRERVFFLFLDPYRFFLSFLITFLVESVFFSFFFFLIVFLVESVFSYFLVFFYKFQPPT